MAVRPADEVTDELLAETDRRYLEFTKLLLALATGAFSLLLTFEQQYVPPLARVPLAGAGFVLASRCSITRKRVAKPFRVAHRQNVNVAAHVRRRSRHTSMTD